VGKGSFRMRHLRNLGRQGYGDRRVTCTSRPTKVDDGGGGGDLARVSSEEGVVCVREQRFWGVCVEGGQGGV
jgi:hypothetical protein